MSVWSIYTHIAGTGKLWRRPQAGAFSHCKSLLLHSPDDTRTKGLSGSRTQDGLWKEDTNKIA